MHIIFIQNKIPAVMIKWTLLNQNSCMFNFLTKYGLISLIEKFDYLDLFFQKLKQIFEKLFY